MIFLRDTAPVAPSQTHRSSPKSSRNTQTSSEHFSPLWCHCEERRPSDGPLLIFYRGGPYRAHTQARYEAICQDRLLRCAHQHDRPNGDRFADGHRHLCENGGDGRNDGTGLWLI